MNESLFQNIFFNQQQICEYFGNVQLATDYLGQIVLVFCNGELITYQLIDEKWLKTSELKLIPQTTVIQQNDYNLQLNGNGRRFFLLQVDQRYEQRIQIWNRCHNISNWAFLQSLKLYSHSNFLSINLSGSMLMVNHLKTIILWEYNQPQTKLNRVQSLQLEASAAYFNENDSVMAGKAKSQIIFSKKLNNLWTKYQSIKVEQECCMQFFRNRLIVLSIYDLFMYKMDDQLHFSIEKQIISGLFVKEPQQCLFMGSVIMIQMPTLEVECWKYENNAWLKDSSNYFNQRFQAHQILQSKDNKKLFIYRKRYGGMVFEKKNDIKVNERKTEIRVIEKKNEIKVFDEQNEINFFENKKSKVKVKITY